MKTFMANAANIERKWFVVDASGIPMGRLASQVASVLAGKHKATYTPHVDTGDFVIVINTDKVVLTGKKLEQKYFRRHTHYVGNMKETQYKHLMETKSDFAVLQAVKGMLPKSKLGDAMLKKLRVFKGSVHPHSAQMPAELKLVD